MSISSRTPAKHDLLNLTLGRISGVMGLKRVWPAEPVRLIDMCAGDGSEYTHRFTPPGALWEEEEPHPSSPMIINKHAEHMRRHGVLTVVQLFEKRKDLARRLIDSFPQNSWRTAHCENSSTFDFGKLPDDSCCYVYADPNTIHDMPLTDEHYRSFPEATTTLMLTLGCNVGGLKRRPLEERRQWFDHVERARRHCRRHHDLILVNLEGDCSQWAYLIKFPAVWTDDTIKKIERFQAKWKEKGYWNKGVSAASMRKDRQSFAQTLERLFLTPNEREDGKTIRNSVA